MKKYTTNTQTHTNTHRGRGDKGRQKTRRRRVLLGVQFVLSRDPDKHDDGNDEKENVEYDVASNGSIQSSKSSKVSRNSVRSKNRNDKPVTSNQYANKNKQTNNPRWNDQIKRYDSKGGWRAN